MLNFIANPIAGGKQGKKIKNTIELLKSELDKRGVRYNFSFSDVNSSPLATKALTEELISKGATDIIAVGGDGTLHQVINGFSNFDRVNLGLIPCGTGNDFAYSAKIPEEPLKALSLILDGSPKPTDYIQIDKVRCINVAGLGIDVEVLKKYSALKKKTKFGYTRCLIKTLFDFDYTDFSATENGTKKGYRAFIACVANGKTYGGGIPICPDADISDGKLNFLAVSQMKKLKIVKAFLKLKKGKICSLKETYHTTATEVDITTPFPVTINIDGELYENLPFNAKLVSNTLKMYR